MAISAGAGDELAAIRLWEAAQELLARLALAFGVPADDVPDLVQETIWAAHQHLDRFDRSAGSFEAWIGTILVRLARNRNRSVRRRVRFLDRLASLARPPRAQHSTIDALEARLTLEHLLAGLTDRQRQVIALYEIAELDASEVARALGITQAGVRSIARQARRRLWRAARRADRRGKKR